jgi:hypothetical protein
LSGFGKIATSPNIHEPFDRSENKTIPKQIKKAESIIIFRKNQNVPLITPDTLSPRVMGVTKKSIRAVNFDTQRSVPLFSTIQFPIKTERVISGKINVISCTNK